MAALQRLKLQHQSCQIVHCIPQRCAMQSTSEHYIQPVVGTVCILPQRNRPPEEKLQVETRSVYPRNSIEMVIAASILPLPFKYHEKGQEIINPLSNPPHRKKKKVFQPCFKKKTVDSHCSCNQLLAVRCLAHVAWDTNSDQPARNQL